MKDKIRTIFRIVLIICGSYGLYLNVVASKTSVFELLHYYTILSNILVIGFFIFLLFKDKKNKKYRSIKGGVTMSITITFLIFHFILRNTNFDMGGLSLYSPANILLHYVVPLMTILDWLIFDNKGKYDVKDPIRWLVIPFVYFMLMIISAIFGYTFSGGSHYPYFFMDIDKLGLLKVVEYLLLIVLFFTGLGYSLYGIDKILSNKK